MKKSTTIGILCMVMPFFSVAAFANDVAVSVGIKSWSNGWKISQPDLDLPNSSESILVGPSLKVSAGSFFGGMSILTTTPIAYYDISIENSDPRGGGTSWNIDRRDTDIVMGYMLNPKFGIMGGYKYIITETTVNGYRLGTKYDYGMNVSGPALGLVANLPLGETSWVLTFTASYLPTLKYENDNINGEEDMDGFSTVIGLVYGVSENTALSEGLKYQILKFKDYDEEWEFSGGTIGVVFRF